jgi:hypothetical protein
MRLRAGLLEAELPYPWTTQLEYPLMLTLEGKPSGSSMGTWSLGMRDETV